VALTPGTRFGSFEILSLLGTGGMSEVYAARDMRSIGASRSKCCSIRSRAIRIGRRDSIAKSAAASCSRC
jgi:hypothetical protein